jgi:ATP-binding cassette subfamily B protein
LSPFRASLSTVSWAFGRTWTTSSRLTSAVVISALLRNLLPAALVLIARGLINSVSAALSRGDQLITTILPLLALGLAVSIVEVSSRNLSIYFSERLRDEFDLSVSASILEHAARLDLAFFEDPRFQDIMERARQNTADHFSRFITQIIEAVANAIQIISLTAILIFIEPFVTLILFLFGLPYMLVHWRIAKLRYQTEHSRTTQRRWTSYYLSQLLDRNAVPEIRLLDLAPLFVRRFRSLMAKFRDQNRLLHTRGLAARAVFSLMSTVAFYGAFAWVADRTLKGVLTIGDVAVFGVVAVRLPRTIEAVVIAATDALEHALYISNMMEFLKVEPRIVDGRGPTPSTSRGGVEIRNVTFTYPGSAKPAVDDVSLIIRPGETLALVGENGAGKTTLVKLMARFYDPDRGSIFLDGADLRDLPLEHLRYTISFVFQSFGRFEATALENIAFGNWRRMLDDREQVERIARLAGVDQIVSKLPQGYDTLLGRMFGESTLSEGQWQKVAIARALAKDASLLILDEPTSSLDARTEYQLFSRFQEITEGRTSILISHRFSTVSIADRIVVMDEGRIIEEGTHEELMRLAGNYASLYELHRRKLSFPPPGGR